MKKTCLSCGTKLAGRIDKKYCNISCKNDYHNTSHLRSNAFEKMVSATIRRNRIILGNLFNEGKLLFEKNDLEFSGFNFKGLTGIDHAEGEEVMFFCYEYAIRKKGKTFELQKWI